MAECVGAVKANSESVFCSVAYKFSFIYTQQNKTLQRSAFGTSVFDEDASALKASKFLGTAQPNPENGDSTVKAIPLLDTAEERLQNGASAVKASSLLDTAEERLQNGAGAVKASPFLQTFALSRVL